MKNKGQHFRFILFEQLRGFTRWFIEKRLDIELLLESRKY
jgi:hypothetical protein